MRRREEREVGQEWFVVGVHSIAGDANRELPALAVSQAVAGGQVFAGMREACAETCFQPDSVRMYVSVKRTTASKGLPSVVPFIASRAVTIPVSIFVTRAIAKRSQGHFITQWKTTGQLNSHIEEAFKLWRRNLFRLRESAPQQLH